MSEVLLETKNLSKYFDLGSGFFGRNKKVLKAVDQVSFSINSTSGKSEKRILYKHSAYFSGSLCIPESKDDHR